MSSFVRALGSVLVFAMIGCESCASCGGCGTGSDEPEQGAAATPLVAPVAVAATSRADGGNVHVRPVDEAEIARLEEEMHDLDGVRSELDDIIANMAAGATGGCAKLRACCAGFSTNAPPEVLEACGHIDRTAAMPNGETMCNLQISGLRTVPNAPAACAPDPGDHPRTEEQQRAAMDQLGAAAAGALEVMAGGATGGCVKWRACCDAMRTDPGMVEMRPMCAQTEAIERSPHAEVACNGMLGTIQHTSMNLPAACRAAAP